MRGEAAHQMTQGKTPAALKKQKEKRNTTGGPCLRTTSDVPEPLRFQAPHTGLLYFPISWRTDYRVDDFFPP